MTIDGYSNRTKMVARIAVIAAIGAGVLSACGDKGKDKEKESTTSPTATTSATTSAPAPSSPEVTPSEKGGPTKGGNKFSPTVIAPAAPTALPGNVITAPH